jgi:integrase
MSFRSGQSGNVVRKGQMWHGRYYVDVPGKDERRRVSVPIGSIHTMKRNEAKRKLRAMLDEMGLNSDLHLERAARGGRTFAEEVAWWRTNKLSLFKPSCQESMGSHLDKYLIPHFGASPVAAIDDRSTQEFIARLTKVEHKWPNGVSRKLSSKTIRNVVGVLKQILGEKVWRDWPDLTFPEDPVKEQRWFTPDEMRQIVNASTGQWRVLFATLAGSGMRIGEASGLHVEDLNLKDGRIYVRRSVRNGVEGTPKTKKGYRVFYIEPVIVEMLKQHLGTRTTGRVFQTRKGTPFSKGNVRRKLNQILAKLSLAPGGSHAFRHGRVSVLRSAGVPDDLVKEMVGHSNLSTTAGYTHFGDDFRRQTVHSVALFTKENPLVGPNGPNFVENSGVNGNV